MSDIYGMSEDGNYGIITEICIPETPNMDTVRVHYAYWDDEADNISFACVSFNKIYTNGKARFQKFCYDFDLIDDEDQLDFSRAIAQFCMDSYDPQVGMQLKPVYESPYDDDFTEQLEDEFSEVDVNEDILNIPSLLKEYWMLPFYDRDEMMTEAHFGIITDINIYPSKDYANDSTVRFKVTIFNGGKSASYDYYFNDIYTVGNKSYFGFLSQFQGAVQDQRFHHEKAMFKPLEVRLRQSYTGRIYISSAVPYRYTSKAEKEQVKLLTKAYKRYMTAKSADDQPFDFEEL